MYCILLAYNSGVTTELGSTRVRSLTENLGLLLFCPPPLFMFNAGRVGEAVEGEGWGSRDGGNGEAL